MKFKIRAVFKILSFSFILTFLIVNDPLNIKQEFLKFLFNKYSSKNVIKYKDEINKLERLLDEPFIFVVAYTTPRIEDIFYDILNQKFSIDCNQKSRFIDRVLDYTESVYKNDKRSVTFMKAAGVSKDMVETSVALLTLSVMRRLKPSNHTFSCNSETKNFEHIQFLKTYFKNSKFIVYVQDGRDFSYSFSNSSELFYTNLKEWNKRYSTASKECSKLGSLKCKIIKYEEIIKNPYQVINDLENFLKIPSQTNFKIPQFYYESNKSVNKSPNYDPLLIDKDFEMLKNFKYI